MNSAFDPYHRWLGIAPDEQPPHHYRLLGLRAFEADADVIESAADRQMAHLRSFQAGKHGTVAERILNELSAARVVLLTAEKKAAYDAQLKTQLARQERQRARETALPVAQAIPLETPAAPIAVATALPARPSAPLNVLAPIAVSSPLRNQRRAQTSALVVGAAGLVALLVGAAAVLAVVRPWESGVDEGIGPVAVVSPPIDDGGVPPDRETPPSSTNDAPPQPRRCAARFATGAAADDCAGRSAAQRAGR